MESLTPQIPIENKTDEMIKKQEERIHNVESKALQIANLYFVFQGVVVSSSIASQSLKCDHFWFPFTLSLLAALLNFVAFIATLLKWLHYKQGLADLRAQDRANKSNGNTPANSQSDPDNKKQKGDPLYRCLRRVFAIVAIGLFMAFSIVVLVGCHVILCNSKDQVDCVKCAKNCPAS